MPTPGITIGAGGPDKRIALEVTIGAIAPEGINAPEDPDAPEGVTAPDAP
jgi:hypothetical protein